MKLAEMTWPEVEKLSRDVVVVFPIASFEQHSLHLPFITDTMVLEELIKRMEEQVRDAVLALPTQWLGYSYHHMKFSGSLTAKSETHLNMIVDTVSSIVDAGFNKVLIVNGHGGNQSNMAVALQRLREQYENAKIYGCATWGVASEEMDEIKESGPEGSGHAGETETSMMMHLRPDLVKTDRMEKDGERSQSVFAGKVTTFRRMDQRTKHGGMGDPTKASPEKGKRFYDVMVEKLVELIQEIREDAI